MKSANAANAKKRKPGWLAWLSSRLRFPRRRANDSMESEAAFVGIGETAEPEAMPEESKEPTEPSLETRLQEAEERHQQELDGLRSAHQLKVERLEGAHKQEIEARHAVQQQVEKLKAELRQLEEQKQAAETDKETALLALADMQNERANLTNPARIRQLLAENQAAFPETLREFTARLLETAAHLETGDLEWAEANLAQVEQTIFAAPEPASLLAHQGLAESAWVARIAALQTKLYQRLKELGLEPIYPQPGEPFQTRLHESPDRDLVWINTDVFRHNTVHSVLQVGFREPRAGRVLRRALVRRYVFLSDGAGEPAPEPMADMPADFSDSRLPLPSEPANDSGKGAGGLGQGQNDMDAPEGKRAFGELESPPPTPIVVTPPEPPDLPMAEADHESTDPEASQESVEEPVNPAAVEDLMRQIRAAARGEETEPRETNSSTP
jgi:hypothetical protein